ncbi:MAG TPA: GNAT family N-acetyltransferase [Rhizomicrobium sp.]|jgi:RimJ/RimL family protein N-acetyltransferase|nr:GNAT family N-acetyltransferase [Rhizomicrobium sp.]
MNVPALETSRLILRGPKLSDFDVYAAQGADPAFMRHMGDGGLRSEEDSWSSFLRMVGTWQLLGYGSWIIEDRQSGAFVGNVGYIQRKRDRGPDLRDLPEMGWGIASEFAGKGYATEAVMAALQWGRENLGPVRVTALTSEDNIASIRVAEKCGFRVFRRGLSAGRQRIFFDRIL